MNTLSFRAYLLTAAGVNTTAVVSTPNTTFTPTHSGPSKCGALKFSPNGTKLGVVYSLSCPSDWVLYTVWELYRFDNSTGLLSNYQPLFASIAPNCTLKGGWSYSCEFSPTGKRFYYNSNGGVLQLDFCAPPLVVLGTYLNQGDNLSDTLYRLGTMQLAPDGKIYVARPGQALLGVVNNPNNAAAASNYTYNGQSLGTRTCQLGLPNFVTSYFEQAPSPFTSSVVPFVNCNSLAFNTPTICSFTGYTLNTCSWNFGDPSSGTANTSTLVSPTHSFSSSGTFTVQLVSNYLCGKSDTLRQTIVVVNSSSISVLSPPASCAPGSATVNIVGGVGPYSYTWSPGAQNTQVANNLSPGVYTVDVKDSGNGCLFRTNTIISNTIISASVNTLLASCYGSATGGATVFPAGGSGTYSYTWSGSPLNSATVTGLAGGFYSVTVTDITSQCSVTETLQVPQPLPVTTTITVSSPSACVGGTVSLSALSSGGTPVIQHSWAVGSSAFFYVVSQSQPGNYIYTVTATDYKGCAKTSTTSVYFVPDPVLAVSNVSICPQAIATLTASGAISYNWLPGNNTGNTFTVSPAASGIYSVTGWDALGCSSTNSVSVKVFAQPIAGISSNAPLCAGQTLSISGTGGINYSWTGPSGFSAGLQNSIISQVSLNNSGVYTMTVLDVNSCTATATSNITINSNPTVSVSGTFTICIGETTNLTASGANVYNWNPTTATGSVVAFSPGSTTSYTVSGKNSTTGCKDDKVITIQVSKCTGIEELSGNNGILKLYPESKITVTSL